MKHLKVLSIVALFALFFAFATPQAFAGGYDVATSYLGDGEFHLTFEEDVQQAEGTWTIRVGKNYYDDPIYTHESGVVSGNQYNYKFEDWKLKPGQYYVSSGFHGTVDGIENVHAGDELIIEVTKDKKVKVKQK